MINWAKTFGRFWNESFDRLADYLDKLKTQENSNEYKE